MELLIRDAESRDRDDLADISRNTWEGHDYLERVSGSWLEDSGFIVGELEGRVIACGKITRMPGDVAWLEGLRVHPDFRGKGFGRVMSEKILEEAVRLEGEGKFTAIEFSTYINNVESISMAEKQGFRITEMFHVLGCENPAGPSPDLTIEKTDLLPGDLSVYPEHAPCGWKYIHTSAADAADWMCRSAGFWQAEGGARLLTSNRGFEVSPLAASLEHPIEFVKAALSLAASRGMDYVEIMIHDSHKTVLKAATDCGFTYWEDPDKSNIPVYRHFRH